MREEQAVPGFGERRGDVRGAAQVQGRRRLQGSLPNEFGRAARRVQVQVPCRNIQIH